MGKAMAKRAHNRQESDSLNRTALLIGGVAAAVILVTIIVSVLFK